jgi:transcription antitermination factor NusG
MFNEPRQDRAPAELYEAPHWYACYTRARHEKRVDEQLAERGLETYLPLLARERQWSDRRKVVEFPLFPGYVFCRFTLDELHEVLTVPGWRR